MTWENHLPIQKSCEGDSLTQYKQFLVDLYTLHADGEKEIGFNYDRTLLPSREETNDREDVKIDYLLERLNKEEGQEVIDYRFKASMKENSLDSSVIFHWDDREDVKLNISAEELDTSAICRSLQNTNLWDAPDYAAD